MVCALSDVEVNEEFRTQRQQRPGDACRSLSAAVVEAVMGSPRNCSSTVTRFVGSADQTRARVPSAVSD
jgi:hypothetical protein